MRLVAPWLVTPVAGGGVLQQTVWCHRFSAFWLRSSVVSVLISLISDMSSIWGQHIKQIFRNGSWKRGLLHSLCALTWYCSAARNGAPSFFLVENQKLFLTEWSILQIQWGNMLQFLAVAIPSRFSDVACLYQDSLKVEPEKNGNQICTLAKSWGILR